MRDLGVGYGVFVRQEQPFVSFSRLLILVLDSQRQYVGQCWRRLRRRQCV
jgi:hypothetical protein